MTKKKQDTEPVEAEVVEADETALAIIDKDADLRPMTLVDGAALLPVPQLKAVLDEYDARRNYFRTWLLAHMIEGVHYGFPPGCEAKYDKEGHLLQWNRKDNAWVIVSEKQWQAKPSLYKAGALLVIDLLRLRTVFAVDKDAWEQMGSEKGSFVMKCTLAHPSTGDLLGEGRGIFTIGEKNMKANAAIKMAEKRACVDAVINTVAVCGDLFTQDMEDATPPPSPKPDADPAAPDTPPRAERPEMNTDIGNEGIKQAFDRDVWQLWARFAGVYWGGGFVADAANKQKVKDLLAAYITGITDKVFIGDYAVLNAADIELMAADLKEHESPEPPSERSHEQE